MNRDNRIADDAGLDKCRCDVAYAMVRSGKSLDEILGEYSVTEEEFTGWIRDGRFTEYVAELAKKFAKADEPFVWTSLLNEIRKGSIPAIKLYFEIWNKRSGTASSSADPPDELTAVREEIFGSGDSE